MNKNNIIILILIILVILLFVVWFFVGPNLSNNNGTPFSKDGNLVKDESGLKESTWYLFYKDDADKDIVTELDVTGVKTKNIRKFQTVHVEGKMINNLIKVSSMTILNAYNDDWIWVLNPMPSETVTSPLTISGEARGNWYFEASFPAKLLDGNGNLLVQIPVQAQGEWMTTEYVPFSATLTFSKPSTVNGTLVLEKDNPSGLPEHANELRIPVLFGTSSKMVYLYVRNNRVVYSSLG